MKATLSGDEPADVLNYARSHAAFPHESTANQFFTEAQFESYRMLGLHTIEQALASPALARAWEPSASRHHSLETPLTGRVLAASAESRHDSAGARSRRGG
jgi:hypothetical protein